MSCLYISSYWKHEEIEKCSDLNLTKGLIDMPLGSFKIMKAKAVRVQTAPFVILSFLKEVKQKQGLQILNGKFPKKQIAN